MAPIQSLLIANRGEIARRIIRTARRLGMRCIAVYSEADAAAPHVREADEAILIGAPPASESYLVGERLLEAALRTGAAAVHPGYGFLSENADFAEAVIAEGRIWVGAPPAAIRAMGLKDASKRLMAAAGVPVTPGWSGEDQRPATLARAAGDLGWPLLIKAVAGGGGKGMRRVEAEADFSEALASAKREALAAFGDDRVLLETFVPHPRHIEVQVFADSHGGVVHLYERDCSVQRRHQKVIEEAPAPGMEEATREALCAAAVRAARAVGYQGAGTVEFIADASRGLRADRLWFMEMNTRLQVEHPVTEAVTGVDLVEWQLRVAAGEPLPLVQQQIPLRGHAMEARLYAEDPAKGFLPSTGRLEHFRLPSHARIDSGVEEGGVIGPFYDPMIAKLIVHADDRPAAAEALRQACGGVEVWPVKTNAGFLARCVAHPDFRAGGVDTGFIPDHLEQLAGRTQPVPTRGEVAALGVSPDHWPGDAPDSPWRPQNRLVGFRLNRPAIDHAPVHIEDETVELPFEFRTRARVWPLGDGRGVIFREGDAWEIGLWRPRGVRAGPAAGDGIVRAPMPGRIVSVTVEVGQCVAAGETLAVLEAMKMEHTLAAPFAAVVDEVAARQGAQVAEGFALIKLTPAV